MECKSLYCLNRLAALFLLIFVSFVTATGQTFSQSDTTDLDGLFAELRQDDLEESEWSDIERQIWMQWSQSGSKAVDFLLRRGTEAMESGRLYDAVGHFTAAIDHAPDFAEAWNKRATAYFFQDKIGPSMADVQQTLALESRHFGGLAGLGMMLERTGRPEGALQVVNKGLEIHPYRPDLLRAKERLGRILKEAEL